MKKEPNSSSSNSNENKPEKLYSESPISPLEYKSDILSAIKSYLLSSLEPNFISCLVPLRDSMISSSSDISIPLTL